MSINLRIRCKVVCVAGEWLVVIRRTVSVVVGEEGEALACDSQIISFRILPTVMLLLIITYNAARAEQHRSNCFNIFQALPTVTRVFSDLLR